ncbi:type IVB secretion system protein IcmX [Legionella gresilensis]|uniref:type IVB secretion system protein IcmX n=1 Tax=Legionella gresilensis TaxID=91823 RepID=UPI001040F5BF|nr:type IVB secretion system protein IcmX [Legionella gresilensis]
MKLKYLVSSMLLALSSTVIASQGTPANVSPAPNNNTDDEVSKIATYLQNLGQYFGYDLTQYCQSGGPCSNNSSTGNSNNAANTSGTGTTSTAQTFSNTLVDQNTAYSAQLNLYHTVLGAVVGGGTGNNELPSAAQNANPIVPTTLTSNSNLSGFSIINTLSGQTYSNPPYSNPSSQTASVSPLIDQRTYQPDPVSQAILNILATPNYTFCIESGSNLISQKCPYLYRENIIKNVVGPLPGTQKVFTAEVNAPLIPQLNINTLISPLLYSTTSNTNQTTSSSGFDDLTNPVLTAKSQVQQAENFIRYATGAVLPVSLPDWNTYNNLLSQALNFSKTTPIDQQQEAYARLSTYLARLRSYAAQTSVGISNLYYIMSKRLPQSSPGQQGAQTSQALNEYIMASWRLYNPQAQGTSNNPGQQQWLTQINQASSASVQKEIAVLLAEINYQLYLMRQQQERLLLTNSMFLLQFSAQTQPDGSTLTGDTSTTNANNLSNTSQ